MSEVAVDLAETICSAYADEFHAEVVTLIDG